MVHQENNTITKVTSFPPCPFPLLILIKKIHFRSRCGHTKNCLKGSNSIPESGLWNKMPQGRSPRAQSTRQGSQSRLKTPSLTSVFGWVILHLAEETPGFSHLILWDFLGILWEENTLTSHCITD